MSWLHELKALARHDLVSIETARRILTCSEVCSDHDRNAADLARSVSFCKHRPTISRWAFASVTKSAHDWNAAALLPLMIFPRHFF